MSSQEEEGEEKKNEQKRRRKPCEAGDSTLRCRQTPLYQAQWDYCDTALVNLGDCEFCRWTSSYPLALIDIRMLPRQRLRQSCQLSFKIVTSSDNRHLCAQCLLSAAPFHKRKGMVTTWPISFTTQYKQHTFNVIECFPSLERLHGRVSSEFRNLFGTLVPSVPGIIPMVIPSTSFASRSCLVTHLTRVSVLWSFELEST
eukprot:2142650-Amphidinium_carterae.1